MCFSPLPGFCFISFHLAYFLWPKTLAMWSYFTAKMLLLGQLFRGARRFSEVQRSTSSRLMPIYSIGIVLNVETSFLMIFQIVSNIT